jgi:hypothetical protein
MLNLLIIYKSTFSRTISQNKNPRKSRGNLQGEWDDFRTFRWIEEIESIDLLIEESRELLKI